MYFLLNMRIFQAAMLVHQRVTFLVISIIFIYIYIYVHLVNFWLSCHGAGLFQANITDLQILYDTDLENFSHLAIFTRFAVLFEGETKPKTSLLPACLLFSFL